MYRPASDQRGHALQDTLYVLGILAALFLVSAPGYFHARQNVRARNIRNELARLSQAKETWAIENKQPLGAEVPGGIGMLLEEGLLDYMPSTPVNGKWILGDVGVVPRFLPDPSESFKPTLDFALYVPPAEDEIAETPAAAAEPIAAEPEAEPVAELKEAEEAVETPEAEAAAPESAETAPTPDATPTPEATPAATPVEAVE